MNELESILAYIDSECSDLSNEEYEEVLYDLIGDLNDRINALREDAAYDEDNSTWGDEED
jgi:hypothetical protein